MPLTVKYPQNTINETFTVGNKSRISDSLANGQCHCSSVICFLTSRSTHRPSSIKFPFSFHYRQVTTDLFPIQSKPRRNRISYLRRLGSLLVDRSTRRHLLEIVQSLRSCNRILFVGIFDKAVALRSTGPEVLRDELFVRL